MDLRIMGCLCVMLAATPTYADMQLFELEPQNASEVANAISEALAKKCASQSQSGAVMTQCSAQLLSSGQLLVEAPAGMLPQIATVLEAIAERSAGPTPRATLRYWVLIGMPGAGADADAAQLVPLLPVLQQIEEVHGALEFKVAGTVAITSESGESAEVSGGPLDVWQLIRVANDSLNGDLRLDYHETNQNLRMSATLKRGEYVVLGEQSAKDRSGTTFYIVHWPE